MKKALTQETLQSVLHYSLETGEFTYRNDSKYKKAGQIAGYLGRNGYRAILLYGEIYYAHRLAFLYVTGSFPPKVVDHINGAKTDNRWCNLRPASHSENNINRPLRKNNKSGYAGVHWNSYKSKWQAAISVNRKRKILGYFDTVEEAGRVAEAAREQYYGEFAYQEQQ